MLLVVQAVSSRPDIVPPVYLAELEKLQDQIPPFPNEDAYALIQLETGQVPAMLFSELTTQTVAAASLGQVSSTAPTSQRLIPTNLPATQWVWYGSSLLQLKTHVGQHGVCER